MRMGRNARSFVIAGSLLSAALAGSGAASAGFLDTLFVNNRQQDAYAPLPYASPSATPSVSSTPAAPSVAAPPGDGAATTFCVRLCDGRFFPMQRHAGVAPVQACSALCPAAKTRIFSGSEISHASAGDGARYVNLDTAFVYRQKIVEGCTCNGRDAFGLAKVDLANDPTLQAGDIVATAKGLQKFTGSQAALRKGAGFTPVSQSETAKPRRRVATTGAASAD